MYMYTLLINRLYKKSGSLTQLRPKYPTAPILSQQLERSASNRRGFKSVELLTVVIQIGQSRSTTFQCPCRLMLIIIIILLSS